MNKHPNFGRVESSLPYHQWPLQEPNKLEVPTIYKAYIIRPEKTGRFPPRMAQNMVLPYQPIWGSCNFHWWSTDYIHIISMLYPYCIHTINHIINYIINLMWGGSSERPGSSELAREYLAWVGPSANQYLCLCWRMALGLDSHVRCCENVWNKPLLMLLGD